MGQRNRFLRIPMIALLAVSVFLHRVYEYCRRGFKRYACAAFVLCCFIVGNSFAFPVFQDESGFISEKKPDTEVMASYSNITLATEQPIEMDALEILEDEDVAEGCEDSEHQDIGQGDIYLLDEILDGSVQPDDPPAKKGMAGAKAATFDRDDWKLTLINKQHQIPADYTFTLGPIKTIKGTMECDERIIEELLSMMQTASEDGVNLAICSPYRDFERQEVLFNRKIKTYMKKGMSYMEAYKISSQAVTVPGASEHQIGLAIDIVSDTYYTLNEGFAQTDAGIWLKDHCAEYGFILRYPKGKEYITGIEFEPWHFRYVGVEAASIIMEEGLCLEEFWEKYL